MSLWGSVKLGPNWCSRLLLLLLSCFSQSLQSCPTLCDPTDGSPLDSSVSGILQARILEWGAIAFSNAWKWKAKVKLLSHADSETPWTAAHQAPPFMGLSRQEYWSGVPLPSPCLLTILREISPECSLEGLMLKLKLQYFGCLMWRTYSYEKP